MIDVSEAWRGTIDELVEEANRWLAALLPADRLQRLKDEMNPRLVRHYTTQGLLPAAGREGREARYNRQHLLALLALRRLMADGLSGKALAAALHDRTEGELEELALEGSQSVQGLSVTGVSTSVSGERQNAVSYLLGLRSPSVPRRKSVPERAVPSAPPPSTSSRPAPGPKEGAGGSLPRVQRMVRIELRPGLEVLVAENWQPPANENEWQTLLEAFQATVADVLSFHRR